MEQIKSSNKKFSDELIEGMNNDSLELQKVLDSLNLKTYVNIPQSRIEIFGNRYSRTFC